MKSPQKVTDYIVNWLTDYKENSNMSGFVVGVSGGIDSAVTSTLCALTGFPVLCLEMEIYQEKSQVNRSLEHIDFLESNFQNVFHHRISLTSVFENFFNNLPPVDDKNKQLHSLANTRSRIRMTTLYYFAALHNYLVAGTGNKVEDFGVGFYTKYGDGGVDLSPIADLLKTQVYELAKHLKVVESIINAEPTDGLWNDNRTDEQQIGVGYEDLEWCMNELEKNPKLVGLNNKQINIISVYLKFNKLNQHKMNPIPVCKVAPSLLV